MVFTSHKLILMVVTTTATRHKCTCPALTPASKPVLDLPTLEGWKAELTQVTRQYTSRQTGYPSSVKSAGILVNQPGVELATSRSQVRRLTTTLLSHPAQPTSENTRVAPNFGFGFGKFEIRPFFPNSAKFGFGQICGRLWQMPMQLQCVQLVT